MRLIAMLLVFLAMPAAGQVYKWTDENGVTHFGSQPPPGQQEQVETKPGYQPSGESARTQSHIIRQARELDSRNRAENRNEALEERRQAVQEAWDEYESSPDYICTGANDRLKSAKERWEDQKRQGYTVEQQRYYEQLIRDRRRHRDNVCR